MRISSSVASSCFLKASFSHCLHNQIRTSLAANKVSDQSTMEKRPQGSNFQFAFFKPFPLRFCCLYLSCETFWVFDCSFALSGFEDNKDKIDEVCCKEACDFSSRKRDSDDIIPHILHLWVSLSLSHARTQPSLNFTLLKLSGTCDVSQEDSLNICLYDMLNKSIFFAAYLKQVGVIFFVTNMKNHQQWFFCIFMKDIL